MFFKQRRLQQYCDGFLKDQTNRPSSTNIHDTAQSGVAKRRRRRRRRRWMKRWMRSWWRTGVPRERGTLICIHDERERELRVRSQNEGESV
jgi:hypothetical protein